MILGRHAVDRKRPAQGPQRDLLLRIGIDSGPVVAGVIGRRKFIYDLWGDTVNTASRMESSGVAGRIQVTEATYRRLRDRYPFEERGETGVKGKGRVRTYLLVADDIRSTPSLAILDGAKPRRRP